VEIKAPAFADGRPDQEACCGAHDQTGGKLSWTPPGCLVLQSAGPPRIPRAAPPSSGPSLSARGGGMLSAGELQTIPAGLPGAGFVDDALEKQA